MHLANSKTLGIIHPVPTGQGKGSAGAQGLVIRTGYQNQVMSFRDTFFKVGYILTGLS